MKRKLELSEKDIKEAIIAYILNTQAVDTDEKHITLTATENRDYFDRPSYGYTVTATVEEIG